MTRFICIGGKAQNGKTTLATMLKEKLESNGKKVLLTNYADLLKFMCREYFGWNGKKDDAGRTMLQNIGTEVVRARKPNFWVDFVIDTVSLFPQEWDYVVIGDTRFPNEISRIAEKGYDVAFVRIVRPLFNNALTEDQQKHKSETALDSVSADYTVINDKTLDILKGKATELCRRIAEDGGRHTPAGVDGA